MPVLVIKNGRVVCPASRRDERADIFIEGDRIVRVERCVEGAPPSASTSASISPPGEVFDATGLIVAPGFIDLHVHLREPGREDCETIESGTAAAAGGGFTAVCAMPNTTPVNDSAATTGFILERARSVGTVRVFPVAAVTRSSAGEVLTDFEALRSAGAVAFSDDGKAVATEALMQKALQQARQWNTFVSDHCEDASQTIEAVIHEGTVSQKFGLRGLPREAEDSIVERDLRAAQRTGGHVHIAHLSTRGALERVRDAKRRGVCVTCEVTPHHFSLTEKAVEQYGPNAKMKPPLRETSDVEALLEGLADGTIDAIATDHAPHRRTEKNRGLETAPFGIVGLETAVSLAIQRLLVPGRLEWKRLIELFSTNPAKILGRNDLGCIAVGALADLTLIDPGKKWTFSATHSRSKSRNTPFDGWGFQGQVVATFVGGRRVY